MDKKPVMNDASASIRGSFALVTYLPDPLGSFLTQLRQLQAGDARPEAHITFLPPRPLALPIEEATQKIRQILCPVSPFELELGSVRAFAETGMLYLSIERGAELLIDLHASLNTGLLCSEENFEFIPHLTLGGPLENCELNRNIQQTEEAWIDSGLNRRFVVNEVVMLWQQGESSERNWDRVSSYALVGKTKERLDHGSIHA